MVLLLYIFTAGKNPGVELVCISLDRPSETVANGPFSIPSKWSSGGIIMCFSHLAD